MELTWLPKTPILHADDTWSEPNHTAATRAGRDKMNTCNNYMFHKNDIFWSCPFTRIKLIIMDTIFMVTSVPFNFAESQNKKTSFCRKIQRKVKTQKNKNVEISVQPQFWAHVRHFHGKCIFLSKIELVIKWKRLKNFSNLATESFLGF